MDPQLLKSVMFGALLMIASCSIIRKPGLHCMFVKLLLFQFLLSNYIDVMWRTDTDMCSAVKAEIDDFWCESGAR